MASLGLKLFYLRTRERKLSQTEVATRLGIRQGTLSFIEQENTSPQWSLLVDLCKFFDVTPTYLADEERGVIPLPTERWGLRNALITIDMWIEVDDDSVHDIGGKKSLCRVAPGSVFFDADAAEIRRRYKRESNSRTPLAERTKQQRADERRLENELRKERSEHPRRRGRS